MCIFTFLYGQNIGLYRDDGLAAFNGTPQEIEKIKKGICNVFCDNDLKITVEANTTKVNSLDVTLDLTSGKYYPYTKEGNIPLHVHTKSNHPPTILKNIPSQSIRGSPRYLLTKNALITLKSSIRKLSTKSGYRYNLSFNATLNQSPRPPRNRKRNITWFNPPYSKNVETNVGKCFLSLIDKHFPKSNPLHKIFNRNTLKLSYSCMGNIKTIISNHNKAVISKSTHALIIKLRKATIVGNLTSVPWMETVMWKASSITPRSPQKPQRKNTLDSLTLRSNCVIETM